VATYDRVATSSQYDSLIHYTVPVYPAHRRTPMFPRKYRNPGPRTVLTQMLFCLAVATVMGAPFLSAASAPSVTSVSPNSGPTNGGTSVTITGAGFVAGTTVTVDGILAQSVTVISGTQITCHVPTDSVGTKAVAVSNANGNGSLASGYTYTLPSSGIAFVQSANAVNNPGLQTMKVTYPLAQTAGDTNIIVIGWNDIVSHINSVTDTMGNIYKPAFQYPTFSSGLQQTIYYAANINSAPANGNTVSVTFNRTASFPDVRILEYEGLNATAPLDTTIFGWGGGASAITFPLTTHSAPELLIAATTVNTQTADAGTGYSLIALTKFGDIVEQRIVTATGTFTASAPLAASGPNSIQLAAFKP
jgi:hypothetical protein